MIQRLKILCHQTSMTKSYQDQLRTQAEEEFDKYQNYMHSQYQPSMEPIFVLGAFDINRDAQDPIYKIGPVTKQSMNLPSGLNHAIILT